MSPTQSSQSPFKVSSVGVLKKGTSSKATLKVKGNPKKKVIPVIFIPGIFASRLETMDGADIWDPDNLKFTAKDLTGSSNLATAILGAGTGGNTTWMDDEIDVKVKLMTEPGHPMNLPGSALRNENEKKVKIKEILKSSTVFQEILDRNKLSKVAPKSRHYNNWNEELNKQQKHAKKINKLAEELYNTRRERGWYMILGEYFKIMERINSHEVESDDFYFPTYGFGYDWRDDITKSATKFAARIKEIKAITDYPEYGELGTHYEIEPSKKVIIVTHSMGSIVTRYASEHCGARDSIHSILHLNQPTTGAPVLYRRFLVGTQAEKKSLFWNIGSIAKSLGDNIFNEILGTTPYHFVKLVATMPGPIELLPTNEHRLDSSIIDNPDDVVSKNNWLEIKSRFLIPIKAHNTLCVYDDIYKNDRLGFLSCKRFDECGNPKPYTKEEFIKVILYDPKDSKTLVKLKTELTKEDKEKYKIINSFSPDKTPYTEDSYRLIGGSKKREDSSENLGFKLKVDKAINAAKIFHTTLQLNRHPLTYIAASTNVTTVLKVSLNLINYNDKYDNSVFQRPNDSDGVLDLPFITATEGDGTVPLTSQAALYSPKPKPAETAGDVVTSGKNGHADIPKNETSLQQVLNYLDTITKTLSTQNAKTKA